MSRDAYVAGRVPDWSIKSQRFSPLTRSARRVPIAARRPLPQWRVERLKARWFALGCVVGWLPLALVWAAVRVFGGAP